MTDKNREDTILAIRISPEQRDKLEKAAEEANMKLSTFIKATALTAAGDTRNLEALLKAVASYLE